MYFLDSASDVASVSSFGVLGKGHIFGAQLALPLTDAPGMPQSLTVGAEYKHFLQSVEPASPAAAAPAAPAVLPSTTLMCPWAIGALGSPAHPKAP